MRDALTIERSRQPLAGMLAVALLITLLVGLSWLHANRRDALEREQAAARLAAQAAELLDLRLRDSQTLLALFAQQEAERLAAALADPEQIETQLWPRLTAQFPDAVALLLADAEGEPLLAHPLPATSEQRSHLRLFAVGRHPAIALVREDDGVRYELMVAWRRPGGVRTILLVGLDCRALCQALEQRRGEGQMVTLEPLAADAPAVTPERHVTRIGESHWAVVVTLDPVWVNDRRVALAGAHAAALVASLLVVGAVYLRLRRRDQQLVAARRRFLDLLETSEELIWTIDANGFLTELNDAASTILGTTPAALIGRPLADLLGGDAAEGHGEALARLLAGEPMRNRIVRQRTPEGAEIFLSYTAIPMRDRAGRIIGASGTATQISEQVRQTQALLRKERRYRQMFERNRAIKLVVDAASARIADANSAAAEFYGYPLEELRGMPVQVINGLGEAQIRDNIHRAREGLQHRFQVTHRLASGELREVEIQAGPIESDNGLQLYLIVSDITERVRTEQALRASEGQLRTIVEAAAEGIVVFDRDGRVRIFNPAAEVIFGRPRESAVGHPVAPIFPFFDRERNGRPLEEYLSGWLLPHLTTREISTTRSDGSELPLRLCLSRVAREGEEVLFVALVQDLTESRRTEQRLAYLSQHDVVTGLLNRREFERRLEVLIAGALTAAPRQHVICYIDVDQFKLINDTCGHIAGDDLLRQLTTLLRAQVGETDMIGRLGGDEFSMLLPDCPIERAREVCDNLLQVIRTFSFTWDGKEFDISVSIGIVGFDPQLESGSSILSAADVACHLAKEEGRNRIHVYHAGDSELARRQLDMHLVARITGALNEGRFHLYLQPIRSVQTSDDSAHYEILVRMIDEAGEQLIPDRFIPAAERYILMPQIDRWIINRVFSTQGEALRAWAAAAPPAGEFLFAINLSGTSLADDGFLGYLERQFEAWRIPHRAICFEITETAAVTNMERARRLIERLRALGCAFALDDFGAGVSSYNYLKELPVDFLKIDGAFVKRMTTDPVDYAMVESINQIGHILGLRTIAEWAEDTATLTQLRALNVDYAQGYVMGQPEALDDFVLPRPATRNRGVS